MTEKWLILVPLRVTEPLPELSVNEIEGPFDVRPAAWHPSKGNSHRGYVCQINATLQHVFRGEVAAHDCSSHLIREDPEKTLTEVGLAVAE